MEQDTSIDWEEGRAMVSATPLQMRFARYLHEGFNQTQAAKRAGYSGSETGIRAVASKAAANEKVRALVQWAKAGGGGVPDNPGDSKELRKILWKHARGGDSQRAIRAAEVLHKFEEADRAAGQAPTDDGLGVWRMARDFMRIAGGDGAAAFMLLHRAGLAALPLLHDLYPAAAERWPELIAAMRARENAPGLEALDARLADPTWQRENRERDCNQDVRAKIWGEVGWHVPDTGPARPEAKTNGAGDRASADTPAAPGAEATQHAVAD